MPKFKIIKGEGLDATIEKTEHQPTEFNLATVKEHLGAVEKTIKESEAKISLEKAIIKNIYKNNPKIKDVDDRLQQACYLLIKSTMAIVPVQEQVDNLKESMIEYGKELKEIEEQTGLKI